jgi:hypothetical protein
MVQLFDVAASASMLILSVGIIWMAKVTQDTYNYQKEKDKKYDDEIKAHQAKFKNVKNPQ